MKKLDEHGAMNSDEYEQREIRFAPQTFRVRGDGSFEYLERNEQGQCRPAPEPEWQIVHRETSKMSYANCATSEPSPSDLYTLDDACARFFPGLGVTPSDLRSLAKRKRLALVSICRKKFVRGEDLKEMVLCLAEQNRRASGLKSEKAGNRNGSSSTQAEKSARASIERMLMERPAPSKSTSKANTHPAAAVIPLRSR
ncbi:hypothetical protein JDN40_10635 [Rhodomicrobium vannielii ATCC 17100]|uniref:Uncharacterized protein n=1 Tax=Rhodomicrobium udaipurense TaxID=1202716 RepID=A0A8I1GEN2_9HYPH|nr:MULTISPECIES: hypothetical protein [Rhodomicrobium]KAI95733.1 hypothetical protein T281_03875 [Rhodomicrobium udaipurense JA643]MBJ7534560.1 hypothetical protein [Rhodomicrobium vannielii ATCC 17100]MBJ7542256.1 hypothetical protein [Rhodomicrobium udaipurense]